MDEPDAAVKYGPRITVAVLRTDEQGRPVIRCPNLGHDEELVADERGIYECPETKMLTDHVSRALTPALDRILGI